MRDRWGPVRLWPRLIRVGMWSGLRQTYLGGADLQITNYIGSTWRVCLFGPHMFGFGGFSNWDDPSTRHFSAENSRLFKLQAGYGIASNWDGSCSFSLKDLPERDTSFGMF